MIITEREKTELLKDIGLINYHIGDYLLMQNCHLKHEEVNHLGKIIQTLANLERQIIYAEIKDSNFDKLLEETL